jgi:hypothetical protein
MMRKLANMIFFISQPCKNPVSSSVHFTQYFNQLKEWVMRLLFLGTAASGVTRLFAAATPPAGSPAGRADLRFRSACWSTRICSSIVARDTGCGVEFNLSCNITTGLVTHAHSDHFILAI